MIKSFVPELE